MHNLSHCLCQVRNTSFHTFISNTIHFRVRNAVLHQQTGICTDNAKRQGREENDTKKKAEERKDLKKKKGKILTLSAAVRMLSPDQFLPPEQVPSSTPTSPTFKYCSEKFSWTKVKSGGDIPQIGDKVDEVADLGLGMMKLKIVDHLDH